MQTEIPANITEEVNRAIEERISFLETKYTLALKIALKAYRDSGVFEKNRIFTRLVNSDKIAIARLAAEIAKEL
jgi:hypothetical protein